MAASANEPVITAALKHLQRLLCGWTEEPAEAALPVSMFVQMYNRLPYLIPPGEVVAKWRISLREIVSLPLSTTRPAHVAVRGYYECAWGEFSIWGAQRTVYIGFKLGPRFGRGDHYKASTSRAGILKLQRLKPAWNV